MSRTTSILPWLCCLAIALCAAPSRAGGLPSCAWVESVQNWDGSYGWSWSHDDEWSLPPDTSLSATTQDLGSGQFFLEGALGSFTGDIDGSLHLDDHFQAQTASSGSTFQHTVLSGPIVGPFFGAAQMTLMLDTFDCTYTWSAVAFGDGTVTTEAGSDPIDMQPNAIFPGPHPIPEVPSPLVFSGPAMVTLNPNVLSPDPQYTPYGEAATRSLTRANPPSPSPAQLDWIFQPGDASVPINDACAGATFLLGGDLQDTSFATTDASDPAPSCGTGDRSVWFTFFAPATGTAQISTSGSGYSTTVSVWPVAQSCGALTAEVACGANGATVPVQANTAYRVQVQRSAAGGTGVLHVSVSVPEPGAATSALAALFAIAQMRRARPRQ